MDTVLSPVLVSYIFPVFLTTVVGTELYKLVSNDKRTALEVADINIFPYILPDPDFMQKLWENIIIV